MDQFSQWKITKIYGFKIYSQSTKRYEKIVRNYQYQGEGEMGIQIWKLFCPVGICCLKETRTFILINFQCTGVRKRDPDLYMTGSLTGLESLLLLLKLPRSVNLRPWTWVRIFLDWPCLQVLGKHKYKSTLK